MSTTLTDADTLSAARERFFAAVKDDWSAVGGAYLAWCKAVARYDAERSGDWDGLAARPSRPSAAFIPEFGQALATAMQAAVIATVAEADTED